jgi:hypothetical protein
VVAWLRGAKRVDGVVEMWAGMVESTRTTNSAKSTLKQKRKTNKTNKKTNELHKCE